MRLILMRHGEDIAGYRGGWSKHGLTERGRKQVLDAALRLKKYDFDYIVSSDLKRAKETALIVADICQKKIQFNADIREINNGKLAGLDNRLAHQLYPNLYYNTLAYEESYPNGESPACFFTRVSHFYHKMLSQPHNVLVITHGGVINAMYCISRNIAHTNHYNAINIKHGDYIVLEINTDL